jgi:hypothetical protein
LSKGNRGSDGFGQSGRIGSGNPTPAKEKDTHMLVKAGNGGTQGQTPSIREIRAWKQAWFSPQPLAAPAPSIDPPKEKQPRLLVGPSEVRSEGRAFRSMIEMFHGAVRWAVQFNPKYFKHLNITCDEVSEQVIEHCPQLDLASRFIIVFMLPVLARLSKACRR